jgi:hypothetical protein
MAENYPDEVAIKKPGVKKKSAAKKTKAKHR